MSSEHHASPQATKHHCHWPGCNTAVPPKLWGCARHWYALPSDLRNKVWQAYRPGQEISKTPSREYIEVAREVREWIEKNPNAAVPASPKSASASSASQTRPLVNGTGSAKPDLSTPAPGVDQLSLF